MGMFAGLETLILDFKRRLNMEFILSESSWNAFKKYLEGCIKRSTEPKLEKAQRASIYNKLSELNRISLREAFDEFCKKYSIDLQDLWPVFADKSLVGLSDIRNKLIHGDPFPHGLFHALSIANEHLEYSLHRVIIGVLGWDINKTKLHPAYLKKNFCAIEELSTAQDQLNRYIKG